MPPPGPGRDVMIPRSCASLIASFTVPTETPQTWRMSSLLPIRSPACTPAASRAMWLAAISAREPPTGIVPGRVLA